MALLAGLAGIALMSAPAIAGTLTTDYDKQKIALIAPADNLTAPAAANSDVKSFYQATAPNALSYGSCTQAKTAAIDIGKTYSVTAGPISTAKLTALETAGVDTKVTVDYSVKQLK